MSSELYDALLKGNHRKAEQSVRQELKSGADATQLVYEVVLPALGEVGKRYNCEEYFVPELLIAARAAKNVMSVLMPALLQEQILANNNIVVSGVVAGDLHDLGINIINTMLESVGFRVVYLGVDIRAECFITATRENNAKLVLLSASNLSQLPTLGEIILAFKKSDLFGNVKIMVGGPTVTQQYANEIGADGYAPDVIEAVKLARRLVST